MRPSQAEIVRGGMDATEGPLRTDLAADKLLRADGTVTSLP